MHRILHEQRDWPLHDANASRSIEQQALAGAEEHVLMRRAGASVAALARAVHPHARSAWIACGPGNNGGDGFEAALNLQSAGLRVTAFLAADPVRLPPDATDAMQRAIAAGVTLSTDAHTPGDDPDIAIDALLGLGSRRAPEGQIALCIDRLNALPGHVLAIDLPSGLNPDTGQPLGDRRVTATHTLALLTLKPGLFTGSGRDHAGDTWFDDLDVSHAIEPTAWLSAKPSAPYRRQHAQHKGSFGDVAVVGGAAGMVGAALLAARAAHAAGAGRVYVNLLDAYAMTVDATRPELMFRPSWWQQPARAMEHATVVCGCGGGDSVRAVLPRLLSAVGKLVLDADALNIVATDPSLQRLLQARRSRQRETVLTPHPLEAARLLGVDTREVQADRVACAQRLADRFGCVVVLKGSGSVIAAPASLPWINATGNAALATAGTGDVLAGWLGGCWSSTGMSAAQAARHATWLHGHAADISMTSPLRAADLIDAMHATLPN